MMRCTLGLSASYSINIPYNTQVTGITCTPYTKAKKSEWKVQNTTSINYVSNLATRPDISQTLGFRQFPKNIPQQKLRARGAKGEKSSRCRSAVSWFSMFKNFMAQATAYQIKNHALPKVEKKPHAQKIAQPTNLKIIVRPLMYSK